MSKKKRMQKIARERMHWLFELAEQEFEEHPERSNRYIELALKIGKRYNESIPQELKKNYCKECHSFLKQGENAKIRVKGKMLKVSCEECGAVKKISAVKGVKKAQRKDQGKKRK